MCEMFTRRRRVVWKPFTPLPLPFAMTIAYSFHMLHFPTGLSQVTEQDMIMIVWDKHRTPSIITVITIAISMATEKQIMCGWTLPAFVARISQHSHSVRTNVLAVSPETKRCTAWCGWYRRYFHIREIECSRRYCGAVWLVHIYGQFNLGSAIECVRIVCHRCWRGELRSKRSKRRYFRSMCSHSSQYVLRIHRSLWWKSHFIWCPIIFGYRGNLHFIATMTITPRIGVQLLIVFIYILQLWLCAKTPLYPLVQPTIEMCTRYKLNWMWF